MKDKLQKLHQTWDADPNRGIPGTERNVTFNELASSIVSLGPFYYYVVDFSDGSISNTSNSFQEMLGLNPTSLKFSEIISSFHPDDMDLIMRLEAGVAQFFFKNVTPEKLMRYKSSFNFRIRLANGDYALFNHQAMMLTLGPNGGYGKAINIHTRIDHLTEVNNERFSIIGLDGEPSFLNIPLDDSQSSFSFSAKEIQVIKDLSDGLDSEEIATKLFISPHTVKTHRKNILQKSGCKNVAQLIKMCVLQGLI
ncbi:MAG: LuxR family transcriptional regulator [Flavobacterium sp.]|uniref:LuxR C-terminal-related transcriptional regulator n=1 Tax=Flavobacterium sp. TaxID=239 RepID=UPI0011F6BBA1|nr:LuxR C-terminal-related transcriptional regulator [Flavobacterium sp.]RZJ65972.1 MAG: LuxR family transcriptional regulator [Flavobacterium sp.]